MKPVYIKIDEDGNKFYFSDKAMQVLHRVDGPAIEYADGTKEWWVNGEVSADGLMVWYIMDISNLSKITKQETQKTQETPKRQLMPRINIQKTIAIIVVLILFANAMGGVVSAYLPSYRSFFDNTINAIGLGFAISVVLKYWKLF